MQFLPLLLALTPSADARDADASELAGVHTHTGELAIDGTVELPLFACTDDARISCVEIALESGDKYLLRVVPGEAHVALSAGFMGALGLEFKEKTLKGPRLENRQAKKEIVVKTAELAELDLGGGVVLTDLVVTEAPTFPNVKPSDPGDAHASRIAGTLGLNYFPGLNFALLRSQGVLKLSTADSLVGLSGGTPVESTYAPGSIYARGTVFKHLPPSSVLVGGTVDGSETSVRLSQGHQSAVNRELVGERTPDFAIGPVDFHALDTQAAGLTLTATASEHGWGYIESGLGLNLGIEYLWATDWAMDNSTGQVALAWAVQDARKDWSPTLVAELSKALTPEADPETGEVPPAPEAEALAGILAGLAGAYALTDQVDEELDALKRATEAEPENCAHHLAYGNALLDYGRPVEAIPSLTQAGSIWDAWDLMDKWQQDAWRLWVNDLEGGSLKARMKRSLIQAAKLQWKQNVEDGLMIYHVGIELAEREEAGLDPDKTPIQPNVCYSAYGSLAAAHAATGDLDAVNELYRERLDYDASVAVAAGNARLAAGDSQGAIEAYRQAHMLGDASGRFGMALVQLETGHEDAALANLSELLWSSGTDLDWLRRYYLAYARVHGAAAAADEMAARAAAWPENPTLRLAAAEAGLHAGRDASGWVQRAIKAYEMQLAAAVVATEQQAQYSAALLLDGRVEDARSHANKALAQDPAQATALTTLGMIAALEGDTDSAKALMDRARVAGVWDPAYAVMRAN